MVYHRTTKPFEEGMIRPRKCPCCYRPLQTIASLEDSVLWCAWDGFFHWDPRYRRLRHRASHQAWNVDGVGNICAPLPSIEPRLQRKPPRPIELPKL